MNKASHDLDKQAAWQKTRAQLPWPEKLRQAEVMREAFVKLRSASVSRMPTPKRRAS